MRVKKGALIEAAILFSVTLGMARAFYDVRILQGFIPAIFLYAPLVVLVLRKQKPEDYGLSLLNWTGAVKDTCLLCVLFFPPFFISYAAYQSQAFHARFVFALPSDLPQWSLYQVLLVALPEEFFYRGYLQSMLSTAYGKPYRFLGARWGAGLLMANLLFALGHVIFDLNPLRFNVFFPGLLFGWLSERGAASGEKSGPGLAGPVLFHALCNIFVKVLESSFVRQ